MTLEVHVRIKREDRDKFRTALKSVGGEVLSERAESQSRGLQSSELDWKRREELLKEFLEEEKKPKSPDVEKRVNAGYRDILRDLRRFEHPRKRDFGELPADLDPTSLRDRFIEFLNSGDRYSVTTFTVTKLVLINLYGLQDGVRRNRTQIARVLGYANSSSIDKRLGHLRLYTFLAKPKQ